MFNAHEPIESPKGEGNLTRPVANLDGMQHIGERPRSAMKRSPYHHRAFTEDARPPSMMGLRSRSNSYHSNNAILARKPSSPDSDEFPPRSRPASIESGNERSDYLTKTVKARFFRRRRNGSQDIASQRTQAWLQESQRENSLSSEAHVTRRPKLWHSRINRSVELSPARLNISEPFDFYHLTHTQPRQVQIMQDAHPEDLKSEFSAMSASQEPRRELRGIKAENIRRQELSVDMTAPETSPPQFPGFAGSPPTSPGANQNRRVSSIYSVSSPGRSLSHCRSMDTISTIPSPITSPHRSSRNYSVDRFTYDQVSPARATFEQISSNQDSRAQDLVIGTWKDGDYELLRPHAVTTPDDQAQPIPPPSNPMARAQLDDVLEEDESMEDRSSTTASTLRPATQRPFLRHPISYSSVDAPAEINLIPTASAHTRRTEEEASPFSTTTPSVEENIDDIPFDSHGSRHICVQGEISDASWEEDIDWCYDNSAEADSNFNWHRQSVITMKTPTLPIGGDEVDSNLESSLSQVNIKYPFSLRNASTESRSTTRSSSSLSQLLPLQTFDHDIDPLSAVSAQSSFDSVSEAVTPYEGSLLSPRFSVISKTFAEPFAPTEPPNDIESDAARLEALYQECFNKDIMPGQHFPFNYSRVEGSTISSNSPRSSRSPISKSSSQESFLARNQRNASSGGSLPDLVYPTANHEKPEALIGQASEHNNPSPASGPALEGPLSQRKRSGSLAKDVAQKSMLSKIMSSSAMTEDQDVPLPIHPAFRTRAGSDAAFGVDETFVLPIASRPSATSMRSASSVASIKSQSSRYSLFPSSSVRGVPH